jgi:hypothetical protein
VKRIICAIAIIGLAFGSQGCFLDKAKKPKSGYVERVREICGDETADLYASVKWRDRDYAQDSMLIWCIAGRTSR